MVKFNFNALAVFLTWMLGHVCLYVYLNFLIPYAVINLFVAVLWVTAMFISHYKWSYFMASKMYNATKS
jgi:hypothetical protein